MIMTFDIGPESCRVCLQTSKTSHSIFANMDEGEMIPWKMLEQLTGQELESEQINSNEPQTICEKCRISLNMAYDFRNRALKSQIIIENYLQNLNQSVSIHSEIQQIDESCEFIDNDEDVSDYEYSHEEFEGKSVIETKLEIESVVEQSENDIEGEYLEEIFSDTEEPTTFKESIEISEQNEDPISVDSLNTSSNDFDIYLRDEEQLQEVEVEDGEIKKENNKININKTPSKIEIQKNDLELEKNDKDDDYEPENVKHKKETGRKNKILTKRKRKPRCEDRHVCDICGNIYAHRGRMLEHRRRHDTNLTYECEICNKCFNLRENMRKHMMTHRGSKPYSCDFCSRTFYYESVKKSHEAIHTGLKPFVCKECNKAFAYAHALKKHEMIHNEVKLFHCFYCKKDFRLQHHMKQHELTRLHQNAVLDMQKSIRLTTHDGQENEEGEKTQQIE